MKGVPPPSQRGFDRKFRNLLALYCERHAFFPDHAATREGENGDRCRAQLGWLLCFFFVFFLNLGL